MKKKKEGEKKKEGKIIFLLLLLLSELRILSCVPSDALLSNLARMRCTNSLLLCIPSRTECGRFALLFSWSLCV